MSETKVKKKKKGHVVRLSDFAFKIITDNKEAKQSLREAIDEMIQRYYELLQSIEGERVMFVLLSDLHSSLKEARGASVLRSVRGKKKEVEEPIAVRVSE